jgi:tRNA(fMet)-specific endonuclease VapC
VFLFDTDHLVILQDRVEPECTQLLARIDNHLPSDFYVSIITFHEQVAGWNAYLNRARTAKAVVLAYEMFQDILANFTALQVLPFDDFQKVPGLKVEDWTARPENIA